MKFGPQYSWSEKPEIDCSVVCQWGLGREKERWFLDYCLEYNLFSCSWTECLPTVQRDWRVIVITQLVEKLVKNLQKNKHAKSLKFVPKLHSEQRERH